MNQVNIYYNKFNILRKILQPFCLGLMIFWAMNHYFPVNWSHLFQLLPEWWQTLFSLDLEHIIILILFIIILTSPFTFQFFDLPKLFSKKPQIIITSQNISGRLEKESMAWDNIASFEFIRETFTITALKLNYRPSDKHQVPAKNIYLNLKDLSFNEKALHKLLTQLIHAQNDKQREEHIKYFLSIPK